MLDIMPFVQKQKEVIRDQMKSSIQGLIISTGKILIGHCCFTWIWFSYFSIKYLYLYTLISGLLAVFPLVSPWMLALLPSLTLYANLGYDGFITIIIFMSIYFLAMNVIDGLLYEENVRVSSYLYGLSVALGLLSFGIKGLVCFITY